MASASQTRTSASAQDELHGAVEQNDVDDARESSGTGPFSLHAGARKNITPAVLKGPARTRRIFRRRRRVSSADHGVPEYLVIDDPEPNAAAAKAVIGNWGTGVHKLPQRRRRVSSADHGIPEYLVIGDPEPNAAAVKVVSGTWGFKGSKRPQRRPLWLDRRSPFLFLLILTVALTTTAALAGTRALQRLMPRSQMLEFDEEKFIMDLIAQGQDAVKPLEIELPLARKVIELGDSLKKGIAGKLKLMEPDDRSRVAFAALNVRQTALYLAGEHAVDTTELFRLLEKHVGEKEFHAIMKVGSRLDDPHLGPCPDDYLAEEDEEYRRWKDEENNRLQEVLQRHQIIRQAFYANLTDVLHAKPEIYERIKTEVEKIFVGSLKMDEYIDQIKEGYNETEKAFQWSSDENAEFEHMCITLHQLLFKKFELLSCKVRMALAMINSSVSYSSVEERVNIEHNAMLQNAYYDEYLDIAEREDLPSSLVEMLEPAIFSDPYQNAKVLEVREYVRGWTSAWRYRTDELKVDLAYSYAMRENVLKSIFFQPFIHTWKELTSAEKSFVAQTNKHILGHHTSGLELDEVFDKLDRTPVPLRSLYDSWRGLIQSGT